MFQILLNIKRAEICFLTQREGADSVPDLVGKKAQTSKLNVIKTYFPIISGSDTGIEDKDN
jgi:hypothetical protein